MTVSEKHMEAARRIANDRFILTSAYDVDRAQLAEEISAALSAAEREGREDERKRCAEIASRDADWSRFGKKEVHEPWEGGPDGARDYRIGIVAGRAIAAAILSEIGEA